jgi:hypothetical protein
MDWFDHYEAAIRHLRSAEDHMGDAQMGREPNPLMALRCLGTANEHYGHVAVALAQQAYDSGSTKKDIALALQIPYSTLRGMVKS